MDVIINRKYDADAIVHYTALQHYRKKSSMYGFKTGTVEGGLQCCKEIVDNSIDEARDPKKMYDINITFFVSKDKSTYQCLIQDFGLGIPKEKLVDCLTQENTSGKYDESHGYDSVSIGTNGVGSKVVVALSEQFYAFTKRMDGFAYLHVEKGEIRQSIVSKKSVDRDPTTVGTTIMYQLDREIMTATNEMFGKNAAGEEAVGFNLQLENTEYYTLFKKNVTLHVRVVNGLIPRAVLCDDPMKLWVYLTNPKNFSYLKEYTFAPQNPRDYVCRKFGLKTPIWELESPLVKNRDPNNPDDRIGFDIDLFLDEKSAKGNNALLGAVNSTIISDPSSTHFTMLQTVIKSYMSGYILESDKQSFFESKYVIPFSGCVSVGWKGAGFDGNEKQRFTDVKFGECFRLYLRRILGKFQESTWERLFELIAEHFEMSYAKFANKQFKIGKNMKGLEFTLNRPGSYSPCQSENPEETELIICEGDSAAGRVMSTRDGVRQAIYKLRGKPCNVERGDVKMLTKNMICEDLMTIIGVRPTDTDLKNMRFKNIIIMTDADPDGYHIVMLVISILKMINKRIIEEGRVGVSNPPLYSFRVQGMKRPIYLRDAAALMDAKVMIYRGLLDIMIQIGNAKMKKLDEREFYSLCAVVEHIGEIVSFNANQLNLDPLLLEQLIHCVDYLDENKVDANKIREILQVDDVIWDKASNAIVIVDHGLETQVSLSHLYGSIKSYILPEYERYNWKTFNLFVSTKHTDLYTCEPCSFMMLNQIFKNIVGDANSKQFTLKRFKGLGEMSENDIYGTCIDPVTRTVTRITGVGDESMIAKILGVETDARKELVTTKAHSQLVSGDFVER